jgi:catechol 2,3-dioxygenase-like lactoylglutathione lyase family enzyme
MIKTYGLTHLALAVENVDRAAGFYQQVLGAVPVIRGNGFVQLQTPGSRDVLVIEKRSRDAGRTGGILHFGFRLTDPADIDAAAAAVERAGGKILRRGEFSPGEPYLFALDLEGYEIEIWYETPTSIDPAH